MLAVEWLVAHEHDPNLSAPLTEAEEEQVRAQRAQSSVAPDPQHVSDLVGMGFNVFDAMAALRAGGNNQYAAYAWLMGERSPPTGVDAARPLDFSVHSEPNAAFLEQLLQDEAVQRALADPEIARRTSKNFYFCFIFAFTFLLLY